MVSRQPSRICGVFIALAALSIALVGCPGERQHLTVFAAASLADALQPLVEQFEDREDVDLRVNFAGSTMLAQVIRRGAPVDLFISAGPGPMDILESAGLLAPGSRVDVLSNALALVVPADGKTVVFAPEDLLLEEVSRFSTADPALAPAGVYAQEALERMGLWRELQPKRLLGANVRTALMYATSGTADAAVVYASDALHEDRVRVVWSFPEGSHAPVRYPAAALADAPNPEGASAFLDFLRTEDARQLFRAQGFTTP